MPANFRRENAFIAVIALRTAPSYNVMGGMAWMDQVQASFPLLVTTFPTLASFDSEFTRRRWSREEGGEKSGLARSQFL